MPVVNRIAEFGDDMKEWRHWMHRHPELSFDCHVTAAFVADRLREFGITEIHQGFAKTGIVAIVQGQGEGPTIGLRADMDALPIREATGAEYASETPGKMHACGHDGHTTMLLGAARYLAETRRFKGRVALIFQPAEEDGGGAGVMVQEGVLDRFEIEQIYALHNLPGNVAGGFTTIAGPIMAAVDVFGIKIIGVGGHGAMPHLTKDPIIAATAIIQAIQTIVSQNNLASDELVISVTQIRAGTQDGVVPNSALIRGTVRMFSTEVQQMARQRMHEIVAGQATSYGVEAELDYEYCYPATINHPSRTDFAVNVAKEIAGESIVDGQSGRMMGAEDFSYMLEKRPGCYLFIGQGDTAGLHHPEYDFNDDIAPVGASFFARLAERALPL